MSSRLEGNPRVQANGHGHDAPPSDRLPPQNLEAELGVIGSCLLDPAVLDDVLPILSAADFYRDAHRLAFRAMADLHGLGVPVDSIALAEEMTRRGEYAKAGGDELLEACVGSVPHAANAVYYAKIVRQKAVQRGVVEACQEIVRAGYANTMSADDLLSYAESKMFALSGGAPPGLKTVGECARAALAKIRARQAGGMSGVSSGFARLDELTDGFQPGTLNLLAARTAHGKSAIALNIAEHAALDRNLSVLYVSMEMGGDEHAERLIAARGRLDAHKLKTGIPLEPEEWQRLAEVCDDLEKTGRFVLDDQAVRTISQIAANARRLQRSSGLDLVIVDYLQLIDSIAELGGRTSREERVAHVSRRLLALAKTLSVPVIALSQLNREADKREGGRPRTSDLRESGALEQDAHTVMLLHRPEMHKKDDRPGYAELILAKHRGGPIGTVRLRFRKDCLRFEDWVGPPPPEGGAADAGGDYDDAPDF